MRGLQRLGDFQAIVRPAKGWHVQWEVSPHRGRVGAVAGCIGGGLRDTPAFIEEIVCASGRESLFERVAVFGELKSEQQV